MIFPQHNTSSKITLYLLAIAGLSGSLFAVLGVFIHPTPILVFDFATSIICIMVSFKLYQQQYKALMWALILGGLMTIGIKVEDTLIQFTSGLLLTVQLNLEHISVNINLLGFIIIATALTAKVKLDSVEER
ncbi:hypothetical protein HUZ36_17995 [Pseudoalteromonas sp. McH1-7]|nr:hypothetical protein [Pseudoalteromonas sp. McH1-7]RXF05370.1 hypothetical protein D9603_04125 [Pseudoalteromonas sp. PS5]USD29908.1 hypothetical protein J8Z24_07510 [Pseudoalteromonas sp. SCSIO 43201]